MPVLVPSPDLVIVDETFARQRKGEGIMVVLVLVAIVKLVVVLVQ